MPSKKQYDLVNDDGYDTRIPLHNEEAFKHGIAFQAKYIGTLDVPRPTSRVEIVAAMRRIRYEFKAKAIKKKKCSIAVSTEGVLVTKQKKKKKKNQWTWDDTKLTIMSHPIYRIFYVSHDSQDLKIFSYIARDGATNIFKCNVFKAYKKGQAMRVVRTIGQAFEVCHKLSIQAAANKQETSNDGGSENSLEEARDSRDEGDDAAVNNLETSATQPMSASTPLPQTQNIEESFQQAQQLLNAVSTKDQTPGTISSPTSPVLDDMPLPGTESLVSPSSNATTSSVPLSSHHQVQLIRQQMEQQQQQTQVAVAQVQLLKDQLAAETAARIEAQARTHQLLLQNRELLEHINSLVGRLQELEMKVSGVPLSDLQLSSMHQIPVLPDPSTPESGAVNLPPFLEVNANHINEVKPESLFENTNISSENVGSPDSGHKEMSSDSLASSLVLSEKSGAAQATGLLSNGVHGDQGKPSSANTPLAPGTNSLRQQSRNPRPTTMTFGDPKIFSSPKQCSTRSKLRPTSVAGSIQSEDFNIRMRPINPFSSATQDSTNNNAGPSPKRHIIITPLPAQDACGNQLELNIVPPKIHPPPQAAKRNPRRGIVNTVEKKSSLDKSNSFDMISPDSNEDQCLNRNSNIMSSITNGNCVMSPDSSSTNFSSPSSTGSEKSSNDGKVGLSNCGEKFDQLASQLLHHENQHLKNSSQIYAENDLNSNAMKLPKHKDSNLVTNVQNNNLELARAGDVSYPINCNQHSPLNLKLSNRADNNRTQTNGFNVHKT